MEGKFDIQEALNNMEVRIRQDIQQVGLVARADALAARTVAEAASTAAIALGGRVNSLEEKAKWVEKGFGAVLLSAVGFMWHVITHRT